MPDQGGSPPTGAARAPIRCVLFDLDGTLLDTAPDMAHSLNLLLAEQGRKPLALEQVRPHCSHGSLGLIRLAFGLEPHHPQFSGLRQRFLSLYAGNLTRWTRPFPGVESLLEGLERRAVPWGVVTNKPGWLTRPLLAHLGLAGRSRCTVCGDTLGRKKPDPDPLLHACRLIGTDAGETLYVGDSERDMIAGRRANMRNALAEFGYIGPDDDPRRWSADFRVSEPTAILRLLD